MQGDWSTLLFRGFTRNCPPPPLPPSYLALLLSLFFFLFYVRSLSLHKVVIFIIYRRLKLVTFESWGENLKTRLNQAKKKKRLGVILKKKKKDSKNTNSIGISATWGFFDLEKLYLVISFEGRKFKTCSFVILPPRLHNTGVFAWTTVVGARNDQNGQNK